MSASLRIFAAEDAALNYAVAFPVWASVFFSSHLPDGSLRTASQEVPAGIYETETWRTDGAGNGLHYPEEALPRFTLRDGFYYDVTVQPWTAEGNPALFGQIVSIVEFPPQFRPETHTQLSGAVNLPGTQHSNTQFKHMKTNGVIALVENKTSADMLAFGQTLVAPTVKTGDLLALVKTAAERGEMSDPTVALLDFRSPGNLVRASVVERSAGAAAAVDAYLAALLAGFEASGEAVRASYTLEADNGKYKVPGYFTPHNLAADADPMVAIMNAAFTEQRGTLYQRAVPNEEGTGNETEVSSRKRFTPDSIIQRAIKLATSDARFSEVLGLVVLVDEAQKQVHCLFLKAGTSAYDCRAEALPVGASAITLEVEITPDPVAPAAAGFSFYN